MKLIVSKNSGFCFGVRRAVDAAIACASDKTYTYGEIIHSEYVINKLEKLGVRRMDSLDGINEGTVIIRSHGAPEAVYGEIKNKGLKLVDATCPFVKKIQEIAAKFYSLGYQIVIIGSIGHPEVIGINGWCKNSAIVIDENFDLDNLKIYEKLCFVCQTTFDKRKYDDIIKKIAKQQFKIVEIFDTICYTTLSRQKEAEKLSSICDKVLVVGSKNSSNTAKLYDIIKSRIDGAYLVQSAGDLKNIKFSTDDVVGIIAGASAPDELIMEVKAYMSQNFEAEVRNEEFKEAVENEPLKSYKEGRRVTGTVISADEKGIKLAIGGKVDGFIRKEDVNMDGSYDPANYPKDTELEAKIVKLKDEDTGCILLSKKEIDLIKEADKIIDTVRNGEYFETTIDRAVKGGLLSKLGTYSIFIPASQIKERFVTDLEVYKGKKLTVAALEINDDKHKIVASHRKVLEQMRKEKEEIFWANIVPNVIVNGTVKRITNFGAFVSVDGFDCLAHIVDLSWNHIKSVDEVLKVNQNYDFLVLSADREKNRVSLGYKQLQPHPFVLCMENHPIGSVTKGKVVSIVPFGAFVEIEPHIEGLVHVSEIAHDFVKNINEVLKVGDEVDVKVLNYDEANKKINLSIKACTEAPAKSETAPAEKTEKKGKKSGKAKNEGFVENENEWSEESSNNPFADLLKDLDVTQSDKKE